MGLLDLSAAPWDKTDYQSVDQGIRNAQAITTGLLGIESGSAVDGTHELNNLAYPYGLAFSLPIFPSAKNAIAEILQLGRSGQGQAKEVVGALSSAQKDYLLSKGVSADAITARKLDHLAEKVDKSFLPEDKSDVFGLLSNAADENASVRSVKTGNPPTFSLVSSEKYIDDLGDPYRREATFKVIRGDADLYSAGRRYDDPKKWQKFEKRRR